MTTVLTLRHALAIVITLAAYGVSAAIGAPRWLASILAGLACAAALALPRLIRRVRGRRGAAPTPDPRAFGVELARRIRIFAADRELGDRGLYCVVGCPGVDIATLLGPAGFSREELLQPGGPSWSLWRRRGTLCLEIPATYLDERTDAAWQSVLDTIPRRLLRTWTRGAVVITRWDTLEAGEPSAVDHGAALIRDRLRAWARHIGLLLPVHVVVSSSGDPAIGPLFAPPLRVDRARAWGFRLPPMADATACERVAAAELDALAAALASRIVEGLGETEDVPQDMSGETSAARNLLPLIPRLRRLVGPASRLVGSFLAGGPQVHTIWPRGLFLTSEAPIGFTEGLFSTVLAADAAHVRPHRASELRRRRFLVAAGLTLSACTGLVGVLAFLAYRDNQTALASVRERLALMPIESGPGAPDALDRLQTLIDGLDELAWPRPLAVLATATELRPPLKTLHGKSVHSALFLPTLERARARLCPHRSAPLTDAEAPAFAATLDLYVLATWTRSPGKTNARTAAESAVDKDDDLRNAIVTAGVNAVWADDTRLDADTRDKVDGLLRRHLPIANSQQQLQPPREDSCVLLAQERLKAWRDGTCDVKALTALFPGQHELRGLIQSRHFDALAHPDEHIIADVYTAPRFADIQSRFADPLLRCGDGGFAFGVMQDVDLRAAEGRRRRMFDQYTTDYINAWDNLLSNLAPGPPERGCAGMPNLLRQMSASEGPLRKLPDLVARFALPAEGEPTVWTAEHHTRLHTALDPYTEPTRVPGDGDKPAIEGLLQGVDRLKALLEPGAGNRRAEADQMFAEARNLMDNTCSVLHPKSASLLRGLVKPLYEQTFRCVDTGGNGGTPDPWCAEVAGPFARGLGDAYPFVAHARRDVQLAELCQFYCPQKGAAWSYYNRHLASVLFAAGDGRFTPNHDPGFVSFRPYNPAIAPFYGRTWRLSNLLFPFGDATDPSINVAVYIPPIDQPGVEVEELRLEIDGQAAAFTNARERWRDLTWPGAGSRAQAAATLRIRGRYNGEPFSEELQERGVWGLFRLLERASEASWVGDHLRFRFTFAALHGLSVDLDFDAGIANELFLGRDGTSMSAFRSPQVAPPLRLRKVGPVCPS